MESLPDRGKPLSPDLLTALFVKYHYYIVRFALPPGLCVVGVRGVPGGDECTDGDEDGDGDGDGGV
jgi:hypothetical protein